MEYLDIVDRNDSVIGKASKDDIYTKSLCHRIAHVLVFNSDGKMVLQKRSDNVAFCPGHWSTAVGGHVQSGETYEQAALREYQEELGVTSTLEFVGRDFYEASNSPKKFITTFKTTFNDCFHPNHDEVSEVVAFEIDDIKKMIHGGEKFHPELIYIINKYF